MMKNNTLEDYKKAIKAKFEYEKSGNNADFCLSPTPANLKKWCVLVFESNLNSVDLEIFRKFFVWNDNEDKIQKIQNFDIDKFRPFQNFLIKNTEISQIESLNLIAVLLNYEPRPFLKFRNNNDGISEIKNEKKIITEEKISNSEKEKNIIELIENIESVKTKSFKKYAISIFGILIIGLIFKFYNNNKNCMIWNKNHYESIDCNNLQQGILTIKPIAIDENCIENFKKIEVSQSTIFFKNNQPCVWYGKNFEGKYEYFTTYGLHPETGKTLKPISKYIIEKYIVLN